MMKSWQSACTALCRGIVTACILMLAGLVAGDAEAQDQAKDATAKGNVYLDDFNRDELGERYSIVDADPNRLTLSGGKLLIVGTNPTKNFVLFNEPFAGDFVATVTVAMEVAERNFVGLRYYVDEGNYLTIGIEGMGYPKERRPYLSKLVSGEGNTINPPISKLGDRSLEGYSADLEIWYFQLRREGFRYTGLVSADGVRWTRIGTHVMLQPHGQLGFVVGSGRGIENAAEFDTFSVQQ